MVWMSIKSIMTIHHSLTLTPLSPGSPFAPSGPSGPGRPLPPCENQNVKINTVKSMWANYCQKKKYIRYLIPFLPRKTWSLCKQWRLIVSLNGENPSNSKTFQISLLTLLPGSPRAPSLPWEQTGSTAHSPQLGNSLHHIMKQTAMKSRSC